MRAYDYALGGGAGFVLGSEFVSPTEWKAYVSSLILDKSFPGMHGLGIIFDGQTEYFKKAAEMQKNFSIHPNDGGKNQFIITYIEPLERNLPALGLNVAFEKSRLDAALLSRASGETAITHPIQLVQDSEKTPGFLMMHPLVIDKNGGQYFLGWVYAPLIAKNFINGLTDTIGAEIHVHIYDANSTYSPLIFDSNSLRSIRREPIFKLSSQISVMQEVWAIDFESTPLFEKNVSSLS